MKTWFITGTSGGFGRILTELLLERGDRVAATLRKPQALDDLKEQYGDRLWIATLDVTNTEAINQVIDLAFKELGRIDVIVNNAGYGLFGAAEEVSNEQLNHLIQTNIFGSLQVTRAALPHLRAQGGGRILQLSSMAGQTGIPALSMYNMSKWAVEGFIEALSQEIAAFNIQATLIEPGSARTNFSGSSLIVAEGIEDYAQTPVGYMRQMAEQPSDRHTPGDPVKMVKAMIDVADAENAPLRLTLGSDAYDAIHTSLSSRLAALEGQKETAYSTDFEAKAE
ncbi:short chain dehydrogenase [Paenibacillus terrae HPL-003]|uniref:Short chain dehydrogenase n=1 Tax=Paenibacillus terrae (strain HPL-003) TaxID=985665 RepID=G7VP85_PAETH|nr:SDR family oxidoreductase [Paenibacillus terrae]AET60962.1 short chain dehydrogenase [Paenibacillus terrae HPL-003]